MATAAVHMPSAKFTDLQQLRGMSIALVVFWHVLSVAGLRYWFFADPISIDTFFVVGGFIMFTPRATTLDSQVRLALTISGALPASFRSIGYA